MPVAQREHIATARELTRRVQLPDRRSACAARAVAPALWYGTRQAVHRDAAHAPPCPAAAATAAAAPAAGYEKGNAVSTRILG